MNELVTMADVARVMGVSASTVSRALRNDPRISKERRQEVQQRAGEMGYRPNPMVSALMMNRKARGGKREGSTLALVTDYISEEGWQKKDVCRWEYEGMVQRADELGYRVEEFALADYGGDCERLKKVLQNRGIYGVLLGFSRNRRQTDLFSMESFAVAGLSAYFRGAVVDRSNFHGLYNVRLALQRLQDLGYGKTGLVVPEFNNRISGYFWSAGTLDWQRHLPGALRCAPFIAQEEDGEAEFVQWMKAERPDSLLVYKLPVLRWLSRMALRVPEDVGVAYLYRTQEEMDRAAGIDGSLQAVGAAAVDLVVANLSTHQMGTPDSAKEVLVKGVWCEGSTLARRRYNTDFKTV